MKISEIRKIVLRELRELPHLTHDIIERGADVEGEEGEECPVCHKITNHWDEDLRRYIHDDCIGEFKFGESHTPMKETMDDNSLQMYCSGLVQKLGDKTRALAYAEKQAKTNKNPLWSRVVQYLQTQNEGEGAHRERASEYRADMAVQRAKRMAQRDDEFPPERERLERDKEDWLKQQNELMPEGSWGANCSKCGKRIATYTGLQRHMKKCKGQTPAQHSTTQFTDSTQQAHPRPMKESTSLKKVIDRGTEKGWHLLDGNNIVALITKRSDSKTDTHPYKVFQVNPQGQSVGQMKVFYETDGGKKAAVQYALTLKPVTHESLREAKKTNESSDSALAELLTFGTQHLPPKVFARFKRLAENVQELSFDAGANAGMRWSSIER